MNILIVFPHNNALNPQAGVNTRTWNLISILLKNNCNVSILHSISAKGNEDDVLKEQCNIYYYRDLTFFGISDWFFSDLNPFFLVKLFKIKRKQKLDIIFIEFPWGFFATKLLSKKETMIIYDSAGVEREFMEITAQHPSFPIFLKPFAKIYASLYEKLVCKLSNVIINVSNVDRNYYISNYKIKKEKTILIQTPSSILHENILRTEELKIKCRKKLGLPLNKVIVIFHGGLPHPPNQEAFDLIEDYIGPNIDNPEILFVLAGNNLKKYNNNNIISLGFIQDLKDLLYSADFAIVPIISGSGMRVKCADYVQTSLPFITTKKGIEGLDFLEPGEDYLLYDAVDKEFLNGINSLYQNKLLINKYHQNLVKKTSYLNRDLFEKRIIKLINKLLF